MSLTVNDYVSSLNTKRSLGQAQKAKQSSMAKLSSGLSINKGADNPAGLLISEMLRSQLSTQQRALTNTQESNNMLAVAEGGLSSVSSMLYSMKSLATHALNSGVTGKDQVLADQMQMNSALSTINRVVSTTNYAGTNLLDGTRDFTFGTSDSAGILNAEGSDITNVIGSNPSQISVTYDGGTANQAEKAVVEANFGSSELGAAQQFTITGNDGARTFNFAEGTSIADMASQINSMADSTGVNAYAIHDEGTGATSIRLASTQYGSDATVRVDQSVGDGFTNPGTMVRDSGQDVTVNVDGQAVTGQGLDVKYATGRVAGNLSMTEEVAQTGYDQDELVNANTSQSAALTNVQGGMQLQLGPGSGSQNRDTISIGNYGGGRLGQIEVDGETYSINDLYGGGKASLQNNPELAMQIIDQAISDVASGRASIGAYQANTLDTNANNLMTAMENTTRAESAIRDTDFLKMIEEMNRSSVQEEFSLRLMGIQGNRMNSMNVLSLLGG